jgi:predicted AAA+ superfamily ATPase
MIIERNIKPRILEALLDSPVVLLNGARQTGKSTLAKQLISEGSLAQYYTLDDASVQAAVQADPSGFIGGVDRSVVIDEVQRAPELFQAIKAAVDRDRRPGRFLLTGSADVLLLPRVSQALVGRVDLLTLWPFSQGEIEGRREGFINSIFSKKIPAFSNKIDRADLFRRIILGGHPEVIGRKTDERRRAWFDSYVTTILQRDVRDLANIQGLSILPRLLAILAARATATINSAEISRSAGIRQTTLKRYLTLLEATFLIRYLQPWFTNIGKRLVKSPKLLVADTGLMCYELGINDARLSLEPTLVGPLLENFVAMELVKQAAWSQIRPQLYHFRTQQGEEVDLILEDASGAIVGIEVKASATLDGGDFKGLKLLAENLGPRFKRGVVLYTGDQTIPFAANLHALPISSMWNLTDRATNTKD